MMNVATCEVCGKGEGQHTCSICLNSRTFDSLEDLWIHCENRHEGTRDGHEPGAKRRRRLTSSSATSSAEKSSIVRLDTDVCEMGTLKPRASQSFAGTKLPSSPSARNRAIRPPSAELQKTLDEHEEIRKKRRVDAGLDKDGDGKASGNVYPKETFVIIKEACHKNGRCLVCHRPLSSTSLRHHFVDRHDHKAFLDIAKSASPRDQRCAEIAVLLGRRSDRSVDVLLDAATSKMNAVAVTVRALATGQSLSSLDSWGHNQLFQVLGAGKAISRRSAQRWTTVIDEYFIRRVANSQKDANPVVVLPSGLLRDELIPPRRLGAFVCVTSDGWASQGNELIGVTSHWIDEEWCLQRCFVDLTDTFAFSRDGDLLTALMINGIRRVLGNETFLFGVTTDNASSARWSADQVACGGTGWGCVCHQLNLVVKADMWNHPPLAELHVRTAGRIHTLATDLTKRKLRGELHLAQRNDDVVAGHVRSLQGSQKTRWHSVLRQFESWRALRETINGIVQWESDMLPKVEDEREIDGLCDILERVRIASRRLEASKEPTMHLVLPIILKLLQDLTALLDTRHVTLLGKMAIKQICVGVVLRFGTSLTSPSWPTLAAWLSPRISGMKMVSEARPIMSQICRWSEFSDRVGHMQWDTSDFVGFMDKKSMDNALADKLLDVLVHGAETRAAADAAEQEARNADVPPEVDRFQEQRRPQGALDQGRPVMSDDEDMQSEGREAELDIRRSARMGCITTLTKVFRMLRAIGECDAFGSNLADAVDGSNGINLLGFWKSVVDMPAERLAETYRLDVQHARSLKKALETFGPAVKGVHAMQASSGDSERVFSIAQWLLDHCSHLSTMSLAQRIRLRTILTDMFGDDVEAKNLAWKEMCRDIARSANSASEP